MAKNPLPDSVDALYRFGRQFPRGDGPKSSPAKAGRNPPDWELDPKANSPSIRNREDGRAPGYDNNTKEGWLVGKGSYPHFDHSKGRR